jgi:RNA-directed DNA polymerase
VIPRQTNGKRMAAKLREIKAQLQRHMHEFIAVTLKWVQSVVRGYFRYHAVPGNEQRMRVFRKDVLHVWLRELRRRSQRSRWTGERFEERFAVQIRFACIEHRYPNVRFEAKHPR